MFDVGWMEMVVIGTVALVVIGPKDLPGFFRTAGQLMGKARAMARDFQRTMEQAAKDAGLDEANQAVSSLSRLGLDQATGSARAYAGAAKAAAAMTGAAATTRPATAAAPEPVTKAAAEPAAKVRRKAVTRKKPEAH